MKIYRAQYFEKECYYHDPSSFPKSKSNELVDVNEVRIREEPDGNLVFG